MDEKKFKKIVKNFNARNIDVSYFNTINDLKSNIIKEIPDGSSIGIGNSKTIKSMNLSSELSQRGYKVFDKTLTKTKKESEDLKKKSLLADWYITGSNAISADGNIVNIDHSGNRVAAMIYGPDNVVVIVGVNKIEETLDEAIKRVKNIAAPLNAKRAGFNPPCVELNKCIDCNSKERVCNYLVIIQGQTKRGRLKIYIVNKEMGF